MIVPHTDIEMIRSRARLRTIHVPVRLGTEFGQAKRCPMRTGGVYVLEPASRYAEYQAEAAEQPTRARAVLWLFDRCQHERKRSVTITVLEVTRTVRDGVEVWAIRFELGDQRSDEPVYMTKRAKDGGRRSDFTTRREDAMADEPEVAILPGEGEAARVRALAAHAEPQRQAIEQMHGNLGTLRESLATMKARNRARRIERDLELLADEVAAGPALQCA